MMGPNLLVVVAAILAGDSSSFAPRVDLSEPSHHAGPCAGTLSVSPGGTASFVNLPDGSTLSLRFSCTSNHTAGTSRSSGGTATWVTPAGAPSSAVPFSVDCNGSGGGGAGKPHTTGSTDVQVTAAQSGPGLVVLWSSAATSSGQSYFVSSDAADGASGSLRWASTRYATLVLPQGASVVLTSGPLVLTSSLAILGAVPASSGQPSSRSSVNSASRSLPTITARNASGIIAVEGVHQHQLILGSVALEDGRVGSGSGGAVAVTAAGASVVASDVVFRRCWARTGRGGALYLAGSTTAALTNTVFENNVATFGGAVAGAASSALNMTGCLVRANHAIASATAAPNVAVAAAAVAAAAGDLYQFNDAHPDGITLNDDEDLDLTAAAASRGGGRGGGIFVDRAAQLRLEACVFSDSRADWKGGAVAIGGDEEEPCPAAAMGDPTTSPPSPISPPAAVITGSTFDRSRALQGAAISVGRCASLVLSRTACDSGVAARGAAVMIDSNAAVRMYQSNFSNNLVAGTVGYYSAIEWWRITGGSICAVGARSVLLQSCRVWGSYAESGGGVFAERVMSLAIHDSIVDDNYASSNINGGCGFSASPNEGACGGGVYAEDVNFVRLASSSFANNGLYHERNVRALGGGYFHHKTADAIARGHPHDTLDVQVTNCTFYGNFGEDGAGLYVGAERTQTPSADVVNETIRIANSTFRGNMATNPDGGGGAVMLATLSTATVVGSTFQENSCANSGGGLYGQALFRADLERNMFLTNIADWFGGGAAFHWCTFVSINLDNFTKCHSNEGGAIYAEEVDHFRVSRSWFAENEASREQYGYEPRGGAINLWLPGIAALIEDSHFDRNMALGGGGALLINAHQGWTLRRCVFGHNVAAGRTNGGGIYVMNSAAETKLELPGHGHIEGSIASGHSAWNGGFLFINAPSSEDQTSRVFLTRCRLTNNRANYSGGAVSVQGGVELLFVDTEVAFNQAASQGGALTCLQQARCTVRESSFLNNTSPADGGALAIRDFATQADLVSSRFLGNAATRRGGVGVSFQDTTMNATNCTFRGNSARRGSVLYAVYSSTAVADSRISHSAGEQSGAFHLDGGTADFLRSNFTSNSMVLRAAQAPTGSMSTIGFDTAPSSSSCGIAIANFAGQATIIGCRFTGNAGGQSSGVVSFADSAVGRIEDSTLDSNAVLEGSIQVRAASSVVLQAVTMRSNSAVRGAAIWSESRFLWLANVLLDGNIAVAEGGAIWTASTLAVFVNLTFTNNSARMGGALYFIPPAAPESSPSAPYRPCSPMCCVGCVGIRRTVAAPEAASSTAAAATQEDQVVHSVDDLATPTWTLLAEPVDSLSNRLVASFETFTLVIRLTNFYRHDNVLDSSRCAVETDRKQVKQVVPAKKDACRVSGGAATAVAGRAIFEHLSVSGNVGTHCSLVVQCDSTRDRPPLVGAVTIRGCRPGEIVATTTGSLVVDRCLECAPGTYALDNSSRACRPCPAGGLCLGGNRLEALAGYWQHPDNLSTFSLCSGGTASCIANGSATGLFCNESSGHRNRCNESVDSVFNPNGRCPFCAICRKGFSFTDAGGCRACPDKTVHITLVVVGCFLAAGIFARLSRGKRKRYGSNMAGSVTRLLLSHLHFMTFIGFIRSKSTYRSVDGGGSVMDTLFAFCAVSMAAVSSFASMDCLFDTIGEHDVPTDLIVYVTLPIVVAAGILLWYLAKVVWFYSRRQAARWHRRRQQTSPVQEEAAAFHLRWETIVSHFLNATNILFPEVAKMTMRMFACETVYPTSPRRFLSLKLTVACFEGKHHVLASTVGAFSICVYVVGFPLLVSFLIYRRHRLRDIAVSLRDVRPRSTAPIARRPDMEPVTAGKQQQQQRPRRQRRQARAVVDLGGRLESMREQVEKNRTSWNRNFGYLIAGLREGSSQYWELWILGRKIALSAAVVFLPPDIDTLGLKAAVISIIIVTGQLFLSTLSPYKRDDPANMRVFRTAIASDRCLNATLICVLLTFVQVDDRTTPGLAQAWNALLGTFMILLNLAFFGWVTFSNKELIAKRASAHRRLVGSVSSSSSGGAGGDGGRGSRYGGRGGLRRRIGAMHAKLRRRVLGQSRTHSPVAVVAVDSAGDVGGDDEGDVVRRVDPSSAVAAANKDIGLRLSRPRQQPFDIQKEGAEQGETEQEGVRPAGLHHLKMVVGTESKSMVGAAGQSKVDRESSPQLAGAIMFENPMVAATRETEQCTV